MNKPQRTNLQCPICQCHLSSLDEQFRKIHIRECKKLDKPQRTPGLTIGLESDNEQTQIITSDGQHLCYIEQDPHKELANKLVQACNSHEVLVEALQEAVLGTGFGESELDYDCSSWEMPISTMIKLRNALKATGQQALKQAEAHE